MKITIDNNAGFCFGVTKAIETAKEHLQKNETLFCLGELVHNDEEMKLLKDNGMKIIHHNDLPIINDSVILFRAHGEPETSYKITKNNHNDILDATCPIVKQLQQKVINSYHNGEKIYIYGKKTHPEIIGIIGNINNDAIVFDNIEQINNINELTEITLYSQTTMIPDAFENIIKQIEDNGVKVNAVNSICASVHKRIDVLKEFCKQQEIVIFVSGENSSNGKSLFSICKTANPNSHLISSVNDIQKSWFTDCDFVGISGATSTPIEQLEKVAKFITDFHTSQ
ncbi:4-hydroxy-3-methylbut-2-enyl diphosphate reductase [Odoribacter sp. OttesenSCG-928-L07]|nr:4-hydroxy-3-methylbut-2-enyl diphosphate reductase [Odoribacter sp. OttesenSCG-928-L07]MDL2239573.1 4-hydroxy-3-methylbut-2-enyl diphosphate reductase [Bacteroidales bacterium OttesenSCG-928-L14]MDL2241050.1 4-hydroxy-3-methylbut-2-enyl diphosphate reductase [Bacteroidales bacterium OttesenSCG-928-K22]